MGLFWCDDMVQLVVEKSAPANPAFGCTRSLASRALYSA